MFFLLCAHLNVFFRKPQSDAIMVNMVGIQLTPRNYNFKRLCDASHIVVGIYGGLGVGLDWNTNDEYQASHDIFKIQAQFCHEFYQHICNSPWPAFSVKHSCNSLFYSIEFPPRTWA